MSFSERDKKSGDGSERGTSGQQALARTLNIEGRAFVECSRVRSRIVLVDVRYYVRIDRAETPVVSVAI